MKITPAHDFNDYQVGKRHNLPLVNIFDARAQLNENVPEKYSGLDRFAARDAVVADLEALGLLDKIEPTVHAVPHAQRGNAIIEPWLTDQWYVNAAELAKRAIATVEDGSTRFIPKIGRRPTSSGCATFSLGASRASFGGDIRSRPGTGPTARSSWRSTRRAGAKAASAHYRGGGRAQARRRRPRHLVLLRPVAVLDAGLAGEDAGACSASIRPVPSSPASTSSSSGSRA